jgi:proline racemase
MCGHGVIAVTTIALERGLIPADDAGDLRLDAPAGLVTARATWGSPTRVASVAFQNVPSFVYEAGLVVDVAGRRIPDDIAFGGAFYAIVDAEAAGIPVEAARLDDLRRLGTAIRQEVERLRHVSHPLDAGLRGIYGTIFTAPARQAEAHLRNVTIFADAAVDRSPCGTGTAAVMAVLDEMGMLTDDASFVHEGIVGTMFSGRVAARKPVGERTAIVPEISGSAWITGEHTFLLDGDDPLERGFRL